MWKEIPVYRAFCISLKNFIIIIIIIILNKKALRKKPPPCYPKAEPL
jgi:hypothetical protein